MKNKIAIASAFLAASSFSMGEIVINEFLSFEGFVDSSYTNYQGELDVDGTPTVDESDNTFGVNQVEISWLFDFDPITAQIDLEYEEAGDDFNVEQAFVTYHLDNGSAITAGRYASMLGFEAFEPTGLYQYSTAYGLPAYASDALGALGGFGFSSNDAVAILENAIFPVGARYAQGVKYTYEDDNAFFGASIQDGSVNYDNRLGGDSDFDGTAADDGGYGAEIAFAYDFGNGVTYFLGGSYEEGDGVSGSVTAPAQITSFDTGDTESYVINTYLTYETGAWLFAAEVNYGESEFDAGSGNGSVPSTSFGLPADIEIESLTALLMANFAYSDQASVTGRVSYLDLDADLGLINADAQAFKYTVAHNYAFTDNLLLVTELSYTDGDFDSNAAGGVDGDFEEVLAAVELIFTF